MFWITRPCFYGNHMTHKSYNSKMFCKRGTDLKTTGFLFLHCCLFWYNMYISSNFNNHYSPIVCSWKEPTFFLLYPNIIIDKYMYVTHIYWNAPVWYIINKEKNNILNHPCLNILNSNSDKRKNIYLALLSQQVHMKNLKSKKDFYLQWKYYNIVYIHFLNHINVLKLYHSKDVFVSMYSWDINGKIWFI